MLYETVQALELSLIRFEGNIDTDIRVLNSMLSRLGWIEIHMNSQEIAQTELEDKDISALAALRRVANACKTSDDNIVQKRIVKSRLKLPKGGTNHAINKDHRVAREMPVHVDKRMHNIAATRKLLNSAEAYFARANRDRVTVHLHNIP